MTNSWKTAISRNKPSAPMKALDAVGLLVGRVLDYGSGKGYDASHYGVECFDPHYQPVMPDGHFDTIVCNFVLNTIPGQEARVSILRDILSRLEDGGYAYITVRTDKARLNGYTKIGTWQGWVRLDATVVSKGSGFITYQLSRE